MNAKENYLRALHRDHPQWVPYGGEDVVVMLHPPVVERPNVEALDAFGVKWLFSADAEGGTYPAETDLVITDIERWQEQIRLPDISGMEFSAVRKHAESVDRSQHLLSAFCEMGLFERSYLLLGMDEALVSYLTNPSEMYDLIGAIADYKIALLERFYAETHFDILWFGDDWGTQRNLFLPPDCWRAIIKPHLKRIYDAMKAHGVFIDQHSCGFIEPIMGDLCELGADMWNPCQPCNDLVKLKAMHGAQITFYGGIDSQFVLADPSKTPQDVEQEVKRCIETLAPGGGYIAAPSHSVPYDIKKLEAMERAVAKYGQAIYRSGGS